MIFYTYGTYASPGLFNAGTESINKGIESLKHYFLGEKKKDSI